MTGLHILALAVPCLLAPMVAAEFIDITDQFIAAEPIHPMIKIPEDVFAEVPDDSKIESVQNFTLPFPALDFCSVNKTDLKEGDMGVITTPYYPRNYPGRTNCEWNLESTNGTIIEATVFDLYTQPWFFSYFDYVMVAKDGNYTKVDKFSGDMNGKTPFSILSDENKLGIRFRSSSLFNFRGMKIHYVVKSANKTNSDIQAEKSPFDGKCGLSNLINNDELDDNIIGPGKATRGSFPWMAALLIDGRSFCGGSIISKRHILTAAHCTDGARKVTVLMGAENIKDKKNPNRQLFNVSAHDIYQHPSYNPITISHDISILHLDRDIEFNDNVRPICLPNRHYVPETFVGSEVRVSGWGKPRDRAPAISTDLKNTTLNVMTNAKCRGQFRGLVSGNLICTATRWNASPCRGDSGGPLIVKQMASSGKEYFMQVGIVSFGGNSCERGIPVGFTRVTAFLDYISEMTGKAYL